MTGSLGDFLVISECSSPSCIQCLTAVLIVWQSNKTFGPYPKSPVTRSPPPRQGTAEWAETMGSPRPAWATYMGPTKVRVTVGQAEETDWWWKRYKRNIPLCSPPYLLPLLLLLLHSTKGREDIPDHTHTSIFTHIWVLN